MSILKNRKSKRLVVIAGLLAIGVVSFVLLRPKPQLEPLTIYKAVTPAPKPSPTETNRERTETTQQSHDHPHDPVLHSHAAETTTNGDRYDWLDDNSFGPALSKNDPWKQIYPEGESTDNADDTYPPRDWYKTEDPALYIEYLQAQLIKQFGDIPEVHTFVDFEERRRFGIPIKDADEYLNFLTAQ